MNPKSLIVLILVTTFIQATPKWEDPENVLDKSRNSGREVIGKSALLPRSYSPLPVGSIKARGWLREQLLIQSEGLSGNLDHIWADIAFSQWIGGSAEGWERGPYWLDGMVALAYSLEDEEWLVDKIDKWFLYIIQHQQSNGMYGPEFPRGNLGLGNNPSNDSWPASLVLKAMTQYYEATQDQSALQSMEKYTLFLNELLDVTPLFSWGALRWQDLELSIYWLYELTNEAYLLDLAAKVHNQGFDWKTWYTKFPCQERYNESVCGSALSSHGVNNAQAIKVGAVTYRLTGSVDDKDGTSLFIDQLDRYHGCASGIFSADELLAGKNPSQGSETCLVVEYMFSLEETFAILGNISFMDRLEIITFNAMPASESPDMWFHQYVQQANQAVSKYSPNPIYVNDGAEANMFGIAPNYGCCTANFNQGWPKYVQHMWMSNSDGSVLTAVAYGPSFLQTTINEMDVQILETTDYPFSSTVNFEITFSEMSVLQLCFRIPAWTNGSTILINNEISANAPTGALECTSNSWKKGTNTVNLAIPMTLRLEERYNGAVAIYYGPILLSLAIGQDWVGVDEEKLLFEVHNSTAWNYALQVSAATIEQDIVLVPVEFNQLCPYCPDTPSLMFKVQGRLLDDWDLSEYGAAAPPPNSPVQSTNPLVSLTLVPYGGTSLRITEFPVLSEQ